MDILSPAGSLSSVKSAVLNGADAIYMGYGDFNARRNAKNFTEEEFIEAISLCNSYGVDVLVTLNIVLSDRELALAVDFIKFLAKQDITAVIVQDLGVLNLVKSIAPSLRVHASTQLTVHNLEGVNQARKLGFSRVVLSRELSFENIKYICQNTDVEIEV
ncbi:MAG: peptidase U32 family protein, partial [Clostridia bacterium]